MVVKNSTLLSTEEASKILSISRQTLYKLVESREVVGRKVGGQYKFPSNILEDYLERKDEGDKGKVTEWELKDGFATAGIKKMAKRTFQELASNIEELIVNSYDADATLVQIILDLDKRTLALIDDGFGMDEKSLSSYVIFGESEKDSTYRSKKFERAPIGEYGMGGKLAITNICKRCKIITKCDGREHVFNMDKSQLDRAKLVSDIKRKVYTTKCDTSLHGTSIFMEELFYKNIDVERLRERFSTKMPRSQNFKILMSVIKNSERSELEIEEPVFDYALDFDFEENLKSIGNVKLKVYFTKEPIPASKQGIWVKVNGRIVNEKAEWFDLFRMTSGTRYRYRLYGYSEADGLKDFVTFSKNDFIDCPEFREYWEFGKKCMSKVQNSLLKRDENVKKERDRDIVKEVEKEINEVVSKLDQPEILGALEAKIKKEFTKEIEDVPDEAIKDLDKVEEEAIERASIVKRGKDKRKRRNQNLTNSEKLSFSGKNYNIITVDMASKGDLVTFTKEKNLIEINESHDFYVRASKAGYLENLIRDVAFTQIAGDYGEGNFMIFNRVFNELARIFVDMPVSAIHKEE